MDNIQKIVGLVRCDGNVTNLAASIVPTKRNVKEVPALVKWCKERMIFPLVAQLEYAGAAKSVYDQLSLDDKELCELKKEIEKILGEEYRVPFCPALISGICITCNNEIVIDQRTGLSCHSFWLEDPQREVVCSNFSELLTLADITKKIIGARLNRYEDFKKNWMLYTKDVFGGCGGNKEDVFSFYLETMAYAFASRSKNSNLQINRYVYLDNNATTKVSDPVRDAMLPFFKLQYANPNSNSQLGRSVRRSIDEARQHIADTLGCEAEKILFTSSGSEGNSWAIKNCVENDDRKHCNTIISTAIEHDSVLNYMASLKEDVSSIVIVENNFDVISLFEKKILPFFPYPEKIHIVFEDAYTYAKKKKKCDYVFVDIYHDVSDGIDAYLSFKLLERDDVIYDYWIEKSILCYF